MKSQESGYRTSWEIFVDSPDVEILSLCGSSRHHVQVRTRDVGNMFTQWTITRVSASRGLPLEQTGRLLFLIIALPFHLQILQHLQQLCLGVRSQWRVPIGAWLDLTCYLAMRGSLPTVRERHTAIFNNTSDRASGLCASFSRSWLDGIFLDYEYGVDLLIAGSSLKNCCLKALCKVSKRLSTRWSPNCRN